MLFVKKLIVKKIILSLLLLCVVSTIAFSQKIEKENIEKKDIGISFNFGFTSHGSDATSWGRDGLGFFHNMNTSFGVNVSKDFSNRIGVRLQYRNTQIEGNDSDLSDKTEWGPQHVMRDYSYSSQLSEFGLILEYKFKKSVPTDQEHRTQLYPFLTGGIAFTAVSDDDELRSWGSLSNNTSNILLDQSEGSVGGIQFPIGVGIRLEIFDAVFTDLFYSARLPVSDYLDGISEAGNPDSNDSYQICGFNIGFKI